MYASRRTFLKTVSVTTASMAHLSVHGAEANASKKSPELVSRPVIDVTDLYHPHQDRGDNFDLIAAYALPEIDLRAVILDVTGEYRRPYHDKTNPDFSDPEGLREPGIIPVNQLNYIFDRKVPCAPAPFLRMNTPNDSMEDAPAYQQQGIDLLLETLEASEEPVDIVSFGSARPIAVSLNRNPGLMAEKVRMIHLCAGAAPFGFLEWNVNLDVHAHVRLLRSALPVAIYPCATDKGPFAYGPNNCYWSLENLDFVTEMAAPLQRYLEFSFSKSKRMDFLGAMDEKVPLADVTPHYSHIHKVWETAVWTQVSGRKLVRREDGSHALLPVAELASGDRVLPNELRPCTIDVSEDGQFRFTLTDQSTNFFIYDRGDPMANERAFREALPAVYRSFRL